MLLEKSPDADDRSFLETATDMLNPLKTNIDRLLASKNILKRKPGYDLFTLYYLVALSACFNTAYAFLTSIVSENYSYFYHVSSCCIHVCLALMMLGCRKGILPA